MKNEWVQMRLMKEKKAVLQAKAQKAEISLTQFLVRSAARRSITIYKFEGLNEVSQQLRKIGNNISQLTQLTHIINFSLLIKARLQMESPTDFKNQLDTTKEQYSLIWRSLNALLEKAKRSKS